MILQIKIVLQRLIIGFNRLIKMQMKTFVRFLLVINVILKIKGRLVVCKAICWLLSMIFIFMKFLHLRI